ncbi:MAG TPA: hypothetical protein VGX76_16650 [Pirellulales bacterium]|nr:hypothetical protein [Pirellulales bacterium]
MDLPAFGFWPLDLADFDFARAALMALDLAGFTLLRVLAGLDLGDFVFKAFAMLEIPRKTGRELPRSRDWGPV